MDNCDGLSRKDESESRLCCVDELSGTGVPE